jgi:acyl-CoA thioesterase YciA
MGEDNVRRAAHGDNLAVFASIIRDCAHVCQHCRSRHSVPRRPLPTDKELVLKVIPMPADCNANGDIFGGWVMAQVDLAGLGGARALRAMGAWPPWRSTSSSSSSRCAWATSCRFLPKHDRIGRTSITVQVEVYAERFRTRATTSR